MNKDRSENIGKYISKIYRKGNAYITKHLCRLGLGYGQFMFLIELYRKDGKTQEYLSETLSMDKGTTARAIKKLEEENFVIRLRDEHDKRAYNIYLTEKAKELESSIFNILDQWDYVMTEDLDESELDIVLNILKKVSIRVNNAY